MKAIIEGLLACVPLSAPYLFVDVVPPSENHRNRTWAAASEIRAFIEHVECTRMQQKIPLPPTPPVVVLYRVFYGDRRKRDPENHGKVIGDALYGSRGARRCDDSQVRVWCVNAGLGPWCDGGGGRTEIWIVPLDQS